MKALRLAVVGAGHLGRVHARLAAGVDRVSLVAVVDVDRGAREEVAAGCGAAAVADIGELLGQVDAAVVAVPTRFHHAVALELLRRGIHVLVEKPITTTLAEADELIDVAGRNGLVLQVGHVERFNPVWRQVSEQISPPLYLEAVRCGPYTFRSTDVSVVHDLMIHDIDLALWLVGADVRRVEAVGGVVVGPHDDLAQARIEFENGSVANLSVSRASFEAVRRMRMFGEREFLSVDMAGRTATVVRGGARLGELRSASRGLSLEETARLKERFFEDVLPVERIGAAEGNAIADELVDFAESIRGGRSPRVDGRAGRAALAVCEQVCASIAAWRSSIERTPAIRRAA
jgi:predicted dehydrogenase